MTAALRRSMGEAMFSEVRDEFSITPRAGSVSDGRLSGPMTPAQRFTTPETLAAERANIQQVRDGRHALAPMMTEREAFAQADTSSFLNDSQRRVVHEVLTSTDRVHGLQGLAGSGKTASLETIREGAEAKGYKVEGFAPTSRAAAQLREAGIEANTLQSFLARKTETEPASRHLYMLDEASLASSKQMRDFLQKVSPEDRLLVIGDIRQHQGVEAGKPFEQMQQAGMQTSQLDQIMRQKDAELLKGGPAPCHRRDKEGRRVAGPAGPRDRGKERRGSYRVHRQGLCRPIGKHHRRLPGQPQPSADQRGHPRRAAKRRPNLLGRAASSRRSRIVPTLPVQDAPGWRSITPAM